MAAAPAAISTIPFRQEAAPDRPDDAMMSAVSVRIQSHDEVQAPVSGAKEIGKLSPHRWYLDRLIDEATANAQGRRL